MKSTREKILRTLLTYPGSTIKYLSEVVGINGISIRHHLNALEAEGLIVSSEERHGVGRPHLVYSLTEIGVEEFPTGYLNLSKRLLSAVNKISGILRSMKYLKLSRIKWRILKSKNTRANP